MRLHSSLSANSLPCSRLVAALAFVCLAWPGAGLAQQSKPSPEEAAREMAVRQVAEVIALSSACDMLSINVATLSVAIQRAGLDFDAVIEEAGALSATIIPEMAASGGVREACEAGVEWYGPKGSRFPNLLR
jgi:hypothetical protein